MEIPSFCRQKEVKMMMTLVGLSHTTSIGLLPFVQDVLKKQIV